MELDIYQQIIQQLNPAKKVLIVLPKILTADNLASGLALKLFLQKLEKDAELISNQAAPLELSFLPGLAEIKREIKTSNSLVISLDTSVNQLEEVSYQTQSGKVEIFLKAKTGSFTPQDVNFSSQKFPVDIIVALDCASLEDLGAIFEQNADLFYQTPKINIDNKASNEYFGSINLVEIAASSVAEIVSALIERFEQQQLVDEDIATCLLVGIVTKTNSFQHAQTTPQVLLKASELISMGGRHQEIIRQLYKTKPLAVLKLWGRALARLKQDQILSVTYSALSLQDLEKSGAKAADLHLVLQELLSVITEQKFLALLAEVSKNTVHLLVAVQPAALAEAAQKQLAQLGAAQLLPGAIGSFRILEMELFPAALPEAETKLLNSFKGI